MAAQGYQCEFIDSVPEDFYCKQCSLVARKLTITSCCGESYCNACIHSTQQDNKPCPGCGMVNFETFQQAKYQKKILTFQVLCSLKKRGCGWCGPLEHLDTHLDPETGDCEYTDIDCPLKCHNKINKKNISHHLANECVKRDYVCPHCAFKASYEIVCNIHWPECRYFPLTCPNRCGVSCERTTMEEDHMKICPLQEVECELKHIGCAVRFLREDEEEHMREKAQTHLLMMATTSVKMSQDFQGKLQEQERKLQEQERKSQEQERKFQEQERKSQEQERKLQEQERKLQEQERKSQEQERKLQEQERKLQEQEEKFEEMLVVQRKESEEKMKEFKTEIANLEKMCGVFWSFTMENFRGERSKVKNNGWKSPPRYTHVCGYKFCIGIGTRGNGVNVDLWAMKGEYDDQLKWPVTVRFTLELINHFEDGEDKKSTLTVTWTKPKMNFTESFNTDVSYHFISLTELPCKPAARTHFLINNALYFKITSITILL